MLLDNDGAAQNDLQGNEEDWIDMSMFMPLKDLLCGNPVYLLLVMAISALYFVVSGLQFWITTYMNVVIGEPISEVFTYFVVTCVTAPFIGVIVSIFLFNWIGGYTSRGAYGLCLLFGFIAVLVSIPVPFATSHTTVYVLMWLIFFCGAVIIAPLVGMMLNQVP